MSDQPRDDESVSAVEAGQELARINREFVEALLQRDTAALDRLMADDCIFAHVLDGDDKTQFIRYVESGDLQVDTMERDNVEIRVYGSTGVMTAIDRAGWKYKGRYIEGHYRTMHVYAKRDGLWQIVTIQASPVSVT